MGTREAKVQPAEGGGGSLAPIDAVDKPAQAGCRESTHAWLQARAEAAAEVLSELRRQSRAFPKPFHTERAHLKCVLVSHEPAMSCWPTRARKTAVTNSSAPRYIGLAVNGGGSSALNHSPTEMHGLWGTTVATILNFAAALGRGVPTPDFSWLVTGVVPMTSTPARLGG